MASIKLKGDTSGEVTIQAPSVAGTTTLNLPATSSTLATQNSLGVRNLIINGDMRIAQRGTSVSGITSSSGNYYTVDRMGAWMTSAGTWTMTQDNDVPSGQGFAKSMKWSCTTANASLSAGSYLHLTHNIEAQNCQVLKFGSSSAESVTLSFWVKSNKTGTYVVEFYHDDASKSLSKTYTIDTADTWEKKTVTVTGNTANAIVNDNGMGLQIWHWLLAGTNFSSGTLHSTWTTRVIANDAARQTVNLADNTANYINITGVQLEANTTATPFENLQYGTQLFLCQRYYEKSYDINTAPATNATKGLELVAGTTDGNQNFYQTVRFAVPKRANPSINFYKSDGTANTWRYDRSGASNQSGTPSVGDNGDSSFYMRIPSTGATWVVATMSGQWTANAEL